MHDLRQEALLNEYKGNLFEYLVGHSLARKFNLEGKYLQGITDDFRVMLTQQEQFVRNFYPNLLVDLPRLAQGLSETIIDRLQLKHIDQVILAGKAAMAAHDTRYSEADLLLFCDQTIYPLSVKICKANSFVNTKSAGLKSFLSKYFNADVLQKQFDEKSSQLIDQFCYELNAWADITTNNSFDEWIKAGLPQLPGELPVKAREIYINFIIELNKLLYDAVCLCHQNNPENFAHMLMPLLGFSHSDIIQATTFYTNKANSYELKFHSIDTLRIQQPEIQLCRLADNTPMASNFEIHLQDRILQIRVKAMNKFTSKSFKINCSVKKLNNFL